MFKKNVTPGLKREQHDSTLHALFIQINYRGHSSLRLLPAVGGDRFIGKERQRFTQREPDLQRDRERAQREGEREERERWSSKVP